MFNAFVPFFHDFMEDQREIRQLNKEKVDHFYNLYFSLKKRKDLRRAAKSRQMKRAAKEWSFWKGLGEYHEKLMGWDK